MDYRPTTRRNPNRIWGHPLITLGILILAATWIGPKMMKAYEVSNERAEDRRQIEQAPPPTLDLKAWPDLPVNGPPPVLGTTPSLPTLEVIPSFDDMDDWVKLQANFLAMVEGHPNRTLATDLGRRVREHRVAVSIDDEMTDVAAFGVVPMRILRANEDPQLPSLDLLTTFALPNGELGAEMYFVNSRFLGKPREEPGNMVLALVILEHEYQHQLQFEATQPGTIDRTSFSLDMDQATRNSEAVCALRWEHEREAYHVSSLAAWTYGHPNHVGNFGLDRTVQDEAAFSQAVFRLMTTGPTAAQNSACFATFAHLAGHPHPEAYE